MSVPNSRIFLLPKVLLWVVIALNFGLMIWLDKLADSPWGWNTSDLEKGSMDMLVDGLAIFQFVLLGFTLDQIMRFGVVRYNAISQKVHVPAIIIQLNSVLIYAVVALVGYVALYDHAFSHILATLGALSVGIAFIFKDLIAEVVGSITIQTDRLVSINDWIDVTEGESHKFYQIVDIDHRMVTLRTVLGLTIRMYNQKFLGMNFVNLSKQEPGMGSRRFFFMQMTARNNPEKVVSII